MAHARKLQIEGRLRVIEILSVGRSPSERFELPNVRVTVELVEPGPAR